MAMAYACLDNSGLSLDTANSRPLGGGLAEGVREMVDWRSWCSAVDGWGSTRPCWERRASMTSKVYLQRLRRGERGGGRVKKVMASELKLGDQCGKVGRGTAVGLDHARWLSACPKESRRSRRASTQTRMVKSPLVISSNISWSFLTNLSFGDSS